MNLARTKAMVMMICVFCRAQRIAYTNYRPYGLHGFDDTEAAILETVDLVRNHPLIPKDINVRGYIMDSVTGGLRAIALCQNKRTDNDDTGLYFAMSCT